MFHVERSQELPAEEKRRVEGPIQAEPAICCDKLSRRVILSRTYHPAPLLFAQNDTLSYLSRATIDMLRMKSYFV
jgi:hypothetical protein